MASWTLAGVYELLPQVTVPGGNVGAANARTNRVTRMTSDRWNMMYESEGPALVANHSTRVHIYPGNA